MAITPKSEPTETALPPPSKQHTKPQGKTDAELKKERDGALKVLSEHRRATAWSVGRYPLERRVVWTRTRVHLPRTYLAREGSDVRTVHPGMDVNVLVHRHYFEAVAPDGRRIEEGQGQAAEGKSKATPAGGRGRETDLAKDGEREREAWPNYVAAERILARR